MKLHFRLACALTTLVACLFLTTGVILAQSAVPQDPNAAQDQDAGSDVQAVEPNAAASGGQEIAGGGMIGPDYKLGPEDVVTITVFNLPEMTQTIRVENDGSITVKLLGRVKVAGLTTSQLRDELQKELGKTYLEDPHVTVFIKQFHSTPISVVGAVAKPGLYQLPGPRTLIQVIAMAGGINLPGTAAGNMQGGAPAGRWAYITRRDGFGDLMPIDGIQKLAPDQVKVDLGRLLYSHDSALDVQVKPFDTITVSKAGVVYVVGDVQKSGGFTLEDVDSLTALQALSLAQGCSTSCNMKRDEIIHTLPNGTRQVSYVNLGKIMKGKAKDPILTANDMLVVPGSMMKGIGASSIGTALSTVSGLIIWRGL
ncbi:MAG: polysaccharide biosynthesis/export family protein [Terriglobia bacterium]